MNNLPAMFEYKPGYWFNICDISYIEPRLDNTGGFFYTLKSNNKITVSAEKHEIIMKFLQSYNTLNTKEYWTIATQKLVEAEREFLKEYYKINREEKSKYGS